VRSFLIEHLDAGKISTIKLDATPLAKPLYEKLGFVSEYEIERWILRTSSASSTRTHGSGPPGLLSPDSLDSIFELERNIFGADRSSLLESLHQEVPAFTFVIRNANIVEGYGFGRRGCYADHLGPWMATDAQVALQLLEAFLASCGRDDASPLPAGSLNDVFPRAGTMDNSRTRIRRSIRVPSFRFPTNNTLH
jgi:Acetyltransferase (GNAT) domain